MKATFLSVSLVILLVVLSGCRENPANDTFSLQGIDVDFVTQIDVTYTCEGYSQTIQVSQESELFPRMLAYLNCPLGEPYNKNIMMYPYPIYIMIHEGKKISRIDLAACETGGKTALYLLYKNKLYPMQNEEEAALHVDKITIPHDPLAYSVYVYSGFQGEKRGMTSNSQGEGIIPEVKTFVEYPDMLSEKEAENNAMIRIKGTLMSMEVRKADQLPQSYLQITDIRSNPTGVYTIGEFYIDEIEKGEDLITSDTIRILLPFANFDPEDQHELTYGLTQQPMIEGEQYLINVNRFSVKDASDLFALSDFYRGIYQLEEGNSHLLYNHFDD